MIDFGFDKMALIGAVALIVIGPEKLPRVARTVGALMGKARRYVADVKAEVNRTIELEELQKVKTQFETAARDVHDSVGKSLDEARQEFDETRRELGSIAAGDHSEGAAEAAAIESGWVEPPPAYRHPGKRWRLKRGALPRWYKHRAGVRTHVQSAAARVARHRPPGAVAGPKRLS